MNQNSSPWSDWIQKHARFLKARWIGSSWTCLLLVIAIIWLALGAQSTGNRSGQGVRDEIRAKRFVLVDDAGKERAELGFRASGEPRLTVWNQERTVTASLGMDDAGRPHIALKTVTGVDLAELGLLDNRFPVFIMRSPEGKRRLGMMVTESGAVGLSMYDCNKKDRCILYVDPEGYPQITLKDQQGRVRARLMESGNGGTALDMLDGSARERAVLQVNPQGEPDLALLKEDGKPIWSARSP